MREKQFNLRLTEEEWGILVRRAEERGMTPSSYARRKLFHVLEPQVAPEGGFVEVTSEIEKVASEEKEAAPVKVEKKQKVCPRCVRLNAGKPLSGCRACLSGGS